MTPYVPPEFGTDAFNCPWCGAYAQQDWRSVLRGGDHDRVEEIALAYCARCRDYSLWLDSKMIHPATGSAPLPNRDLPDDIKEDYNEARSIVSLSPRGAAAILRLAIEKLCKHLGGTGKLNQDIAALVKQGLPVGVQQALDVVRVVGNNAVHPGELDLRDDCVIANGLFGLVNLIAESMISGPRRLEELYQTLPDRAKEQIEERDHRA